MNEILTSVREKEKRTLRVGVVPGTVSLGSYSFFVYLCPAKRSQSAASTFPVSPHPVGPAATR